MSDRGRREVAARQAGRVLADHGIFPGVYDATIWILARLRERDQAEAGQACASQATEELEDTSKPTVAELTDRVKAAIRADLADGSIPADNDWRSRGFSALHDCCDANEYLMLGNGANFDAGDELDAAILNETLDLVDAWLKAGAR
jgi:hypothetical protein